jgi:hypothetical protein
MDLVFRDLFTLKFYYFKYKRKVFAFRFFNINYTHVFTNLHSLLFENMYGLKFKIILISILKAR